MDVSVETIRANFESKADTELIELASSSAGISPDARFLLLRELQSRLEKAKQAAESVPLKHGWYTVIAPRQEVKFPEICPRCSRFADSTSLKFAAPAQRKFHYVWWRTSQATSTVPHCSECVAELKRSRTVCLWAWNLVGFSWIAVSILLRVPRFGTYLGIFAISTPFVYLYDRTSAVRLGDSGDEFLEYRFRSHDYAKRFAIVNNVQAENTETLQGELEEAISRIQN